MGFEQARKPSTGALLRRFRRLRIGGPAPRRSEYEPFKSAAHRCSYATQVSTSGALKDSSEASPQTDEDSEARRGDPCGRPSRIQHGFVAFVRGGVPRPCGVPYRPERGHRETGMGDGAPCGRDGVGDDKRRPYGGNSALKKTLFNCRDWSCSRTLGRKAFAATLAATLEGSKDRVCSPSTDSGALARPRSCACSNSTCSTKASAWRPSNGGATAVGRAAAFGAERIRHEGAVHHASTAKPIQ